LKFTSRVTSNKLESIVNDSIMQRKRVFCEEKSFGFGWPAIEKQSGLWRLI